MKRWGLGLLLLLTACRSAAQPLATPTPAPVLTPQVLEIACSETLEPPLMALAAAYQRENPAVQLVVIARADTLALDALEQGDADLIALTWTPTPWPETLWRTPFARDGLAIVVHPQNGLPGLTLEQLRQLFQGQVENWESWGGLPGVPQLGSREEAAGEFQFFQRNVMRESRVALTALLAPTSDAVLELVGGDPLAVGYMSAARLDRQVRALAIEGVPPAKETIMAEVYPLTYTLYLVTHGEPEGAARDFIQWVLSATGQDIVTAQGLRPAVQ